MTRRISKWLFLASALLIAACDADESVFAPPTVTPAFDAIESQGKASSAIPQPSAGRSRYAMAAS